MQIRLNISADAIDAIPSWSPPAGYILRKVRTADEEHLPELLTTAAPEWAESPFDLPRMREYLDQPDRRQGSYVIEHGGAIVASCFATKRSEFCSAWGILDYVCVRSAHRGRGLGFGVCTAVLGYFRSHRYRAVTLTTLDVTEDNHRLAATQTYLKLGFLPVRTDENASVCEDIYRELGRPLPVTWWEGTPPFQCRCEEGG